MPASMHIRRRVPVRCSLFFLLSSELAFSPWGLPARLPDLPRPLPSYPLPTLSVILRFSSLSFRSFFVYSASCSSLPLHRSPPRRSPHVLRFPPDISGSPPQFHMQDSPELRCRSSYTRYSYLHIGTGIHPEIPAPAPLPGSSCDGKGVLFPRRTDTHYSRVSPFSAPADGADTVCRTPAR